METMMRSLAIRAKRRVPRAGPLQKNCALLQMPVEIILLISDELPKHGQVVLSQTCLDLRAILDHHLHLSGARLSPEQQLEYLACLARDEPNWWVCERCISLHYVTCLDMVRLTLNHHHVQLALKYSRMGGGDVKLRVYLARLLAPEFRHTRSSSRQPSHSLDGKFWTYPKIAGGRYLVLSVRQYDQICLDVPVSRKSLARIRACEHLHNSFELDYAWNEGPLPALHPFHGLMNALDEAFASQGETEIRGSCSFCTTDFSVTASSERVTLRVWQDLGGEGSPNNPAWRVHSVRGGTSRFDVPVHLSFDTVPHCEPSHWSHIRVSATGGDAVLALIRLSNAAATEGAQRESTPNRPGSAESVNLQPVSIVEAANKLAVEQTNAYNAKMTVFRAFCESFEQTAKQYTSGLEHSFAEQFSNSFLDFWKQALSDLNSAPAPTYSSVAAGRPASQPLGGHTPTAAAAPQQQRPQQPISRLQGRPIPAPPKEDLRVFVRLDAEAPARDHSSYAIRTHIAAKVGIDLHRVPAAFKGNEVNYEAAVKDEIACQTGLTPISIRPSRHDSSDLPTVTDNRPASVAEGTAMTMGTQLFAQRKQQFERIDQPEQLERDSSEILNSIAPSTAQPDDQEAEHPDDRSRGRSETSVLSSTRTMSPPFIMVTTTPQPQSEGNESRPASLQRSDASAPLHYLHDETSRVNQSDKKTLRVFQANVGKISPAHDCALALADSERYDIVLLQEPWTEAKDGRCLTKTHPAYDTFSPVDSWDDNSTRPRVMTYVRRSPCLMTDQRRPVATRDILWLTINNITVVNFYRQPHYDEALEMLLQWTTPGRCLVAGDFNAKHSSWQTGRLDGRGDDIAFWASENGLSLLNPADVPTNPHGNTIDLAFSNIPLSEAVVEEHLATSSDHFTLSVTLADLAPASVPLGKVRLTSDDELARFAEMVDSGATAIPAAASSPQELDSLALALVELLQLAAKAAGRPVRKGGTQRALRLHIQSGDVVYETQLDKANALRRATLERRTADDDIPDPWIPVDTTKTVPFTQQASLEEVRDATLRTGNTSPGPDSITVQMLKARSAVDLVAALLHDIEEAFARGQVATLILRLHTRTLPRPARLSNAASPRDHQSRPSFSVVHGTNLPPREAEGRFGYADDTGIWLDSTLSFKTHVEKWTAKAQVVAYHLKSLANTKHGPLPGAVRRAQAANSPPRRFGDDQALPLQTAPKDQSAADFRIWLRSVPPHTLVVYSDGSLSSDAAVGYGYAIHLDGQTVLSGCGRLGPAEVFDAEAKGALEDSSQDVFLEFQALATAHAKAGTSQPEPAGAVPTLAYLRRAARQQPVRI
ncbi:endonuclease-reverse transcriptase domain-containing protein [Hirsutella rhossiliensis]|uniref:Endonuclease-reverse transcriptase domain-containing protein n=1 Tax=Hirsutella rhossiliensis TaxID=111463 RepID=A0A9P8MZ71_9HYPO|nr:endonuclease-reverse transcriptase domain-containing protein [Hirsutella rhossiliensis]KAH0965138.1 endonuclease-reverse transcriptase domain-containing protein [Hirsutella rhossiliensis]